MPIVLPKTEYFGLEESEFRLTQKTIKLSRNIESTFESIINLLRLSLVLLIVLFMVFLAGWFYDSLSLNNILVILIILLFNCLCYYFINIETVKSKILQLSEKLYLKVHNSNYSKFLELNEILKKNIDLQKRGLYYANPVKDPPLLSQYGINIESIDLLNRYERFTERANRFYFLVINRIFGFFIIYIYYLSSTSITNIYGALLHVLIHVIGLFLIIYRFDIKRDTAFFKYYYMLVGQIIGLIFLITNDISKDYVNLIKAKYDEYSKAFIAYEIRIKSETQNEGLNDDVKVEIVELEQWDRIKNKVAQYFQNIEDLNTTLEQNEAEKKELFNEIEYLKHKSSQINQEFTQDIWHELGKVINDLPKLKSEILQNTKKREMLLDESNISKIQNKPTELNETIEINEIVLSSIEKTTRKQVNTNSNLQINLANSFENEDVLKELGLLGELFVFEFEKNYLNSINRPDLAIKVKHIGLLFDGFGYDIESYNADGVKIYIEVKTTSKNEKSDFYLTKNELEVMKNTQNYYIYRLCNFNKERRSGNLIKIDCKTEFDRYFELKPKTYEVRKR